MSKKILAAVVASVVAGQAAAVTVLDDGTNKFTVGGHIGMRFAHQDSRDQNSNSEFASDASRFNFQFESKLNEGFTAFARGEWGFDVTNNNQGGISVVACQMILMTHLVAVASSLTVWVM